MGPQEPTSWTLIEDAAAGTPVAREEFTRRYLPVVRATLRSRWSGQRFAEFVDDAVQEVFIDCFRRDGALRRVDRTSGSGFRGFLFGITRNVARRVEERELRKADREVGFDDTSEGWAARDATMSEVFDRSWADALVREAGDLHAKRAKEQGGRYAHRLDLLALRLREGLSIPEIARLWDVDASVLHHQYAQARQEYRDCLRAVVAFHGVAGTTEQSSQERLDAECEQLLRLLRRS